MLVQNAHDIKHGIPGAFNSAQVLTASTWPIQLPMLLPMRSHQAQTTKPARFAGSITQQQSNVCVKCCVRMAWRCATCHAKKWNMPELGTAQPDAPNESSC